MAVILKKSCYLNEKEILQHTFFKNSYIFPVFCVCLEVLRKWFLSTWDFETANGCRWRWLRVTPKWELIGILNILNLPGKRKGIGEERNAGKTEQTALIYLQLHFLSLGIGYTKCKCFSLYCLDFKFRMAGPATPSQIREILLDAVGMCLWLPAINELCFQLSSLGQQSCFHELGEMIILTNTKFWNLKNVFILFQRKKIKISNSMNQ